MGRSLGLALLVFALGLGLGCETGGNDNSSPPPSPSSPTPEASAPSPTRPAVTPIDSALFEDVLDWSNTEVASFYWIGFVDGLLCVEAGLQPWLGGASRNVCPEQTGGVDGRAAFATFHGRAIGSLAGTFCTPGDGAGTCNSKIWQGLGNPPRQPEPNFGIAE